MNKKEAMKILKDFHDKSALFSVRTALETLHPELAESEYEKIRKNIKTALMSMEDNLSDFYSTHHTSQKELLDWLEKQGEQKLADKVEPKFKIGDFIVNDYCMGRVVEITNDAYLLDTEQGITFSCPNTRLWDITKDAKDGDVLVRESGWTCIFKTLVNDETFSSYCFMDKTKWFCETGSECHTLKEEFVKAYNGKIYPATKEQCDLLFQKMHEAGYEWDAEKKELKKIEVNTEELSDFERSLKHIIEEAIEDGDTHNLKADADMLLRIAQNHAWSEEDEEIRKLVIVRLHSHPNVEFEEYSKEYNWLKSLKDRVQSQNK